MGFKLNNIFDKFKEGQKERGMFSEKGKAERREMRRTGESKFQYDVRKRRERNKQKKSEQLEPRSEVKIDTKVGMDRYTYDQPPQMVNPNDKRNQETINFGITEGMSFGEAFELAGQGGARSGTDTFFWTNPETGKKGSYLYEFKKEQQEEKIKKDLSKEAKLKQDINNPLKPLDSKYIPKEGEKDLTLEDYKRITRGKNKKVVEAGYPLKPLIDPIVEKSMKLSGTGLNELFSKEPEPEIRSGLRKKSPHKKGRKSKGFKMKRK